MSKPAGRLPVNGRTATDALGAAGAAARTRLRSAVRTAIPGLVPQPVPAGVQTRVRKRNVGSDYDTDWARTYPARLARTLLVEGVVRPAMSILADPTVVGIDRLTDFTGPLVFAANHHSHIDTALLVSSIPEPWRHHLVVGAAADYFFANRITAPLSALVVGAIPIERQKVARRSARLASDLISDGWSVLIFPEGGRSPDGWGQPFRGGAAYIAMRTGVPVVPIHVEGTGRVLAKGSNIPRRSSTTVTFGTPLTPAEGEDSRRFAARIEAAVAALADETSTDWWQARTRAHAGTTPSLQAPSSQDPSLGAWRRNWSLGDRGPTRRRRDAWPRLSGDD
jgi:1-acyl-sn-glycerol-3-phosphate acyltransferase